MKVLRHANDVADFCAQYADKDVCKLIEQRVKELATEDDITMEELLYFVIVEREDKITDLESTIGTSLMTEDQKPLWEVIEEHVSFFEIIFVLDSSGYGCLVITPKLSCAPTLLDLCIKYVYKPAMLDS